MMRFKHFRIIFIFLLTLLFFRFSYADVLVRVETQQGAAPLTSFDVRLFNEVAPVTVNNFLNYVNGTTANGGSYNNVFFHRNIPGFIIQAGGFVYDPANGDFIYDTVNDVFTGGLNRVVKDNAIVNEFKLSNIAGTLAMAKLGGDPDSATSQWFINLVDNSGNLDTQNGGFTVFGEVMSNGMDVVNSVVSNAGVDKRDIYSAFSALPLANYVTNEIVDETKLVKIISMTELVAISGDIDYGMQFTATSSQKTITVLNKSAVTISLPIMVFSDSASVPFSIVSGTDSCSNAVLSVAETCSFVVDFSPVLAGTFSNSIIVNIPELAVNHTLSISGIAAAQIRPMITTSEAAVDYGEVGLVLDPSNTLPKQLVVIVYNEGNVELNVFSSTLSGNDVGFFKVFDNCQLVSPIAPGDRCLLPVNLYALETGVKTASLTILSDDPDQPALVIPITASVSEDTDGVPAAIEDRAGSSGDGNFDGIPDRQQSNVTSLKGEKNQDVTLVSELFVEFNEVQINDSTTLVSVPENVNFDFGAIQLVVNDNFSIGAFDIGLILPANAGVESLYIYGATEDNSSSHWYRFDYDGSTGVKMVSKVSFVTPEGNTLQRSVIQMSLVDGGRGDNDMVKDGKVEFKAAISVASSGASDNQVGRVNIMFIVLMIFLVNSCRKQIYFRFKT